MDRFMEMQAFVAVVDAGSFVRGADALDLSKSVVSRVVSELEQRLGVRLQPPVLGQHTAEIMEELGYTGEQVQALRAQGAVA